jgi:SHS2 domain-containing protein
MDEGWRTFDHTGDLGLEVWAPSAGRLHGLAVEALMSLIVEARDAPVQVERAIRLTGDDSADLLVHWLNTALLEAELSHAVWTRADVHALTAGSIAATLRGPRRDPRHQTYLREIKAVSHHELVLELSGPVCRCRLVLDI